jgi:hypothetical protein
MIFVGETDDDARELAFHLPDENDPLTGIEGHVHSTGEVLVRLPGSAAYVNADVTRVAEKGYGDYALKLTDAQVAEKGKIYIRVAVAGAQPWTGYEDIVSRSDFVGGAAIIPSTTRTFTLEDLREMLLRRAGVEESDDLTPEVLNDFINGALAELWDILKAKADERLLTSTTLSVTAGVANVAMPAGFYTMRKLEIVDTAMPSGYRQLRQISLDATHRFSQVVSKRYRYWLNAYNITLVPTPTADESLRLWYIPVAPYLDDDADTIDGWNGYEELVTALGFKRILARQDLSTADIERECARLADRVAAASDGRDAEPFYLVDQRPDFFDDEVID